VKNDFTEEEAGRCIAVVTEGETTSAARFFFAPVFMRVRRPKFGSQPRMDVGLNACQVRRKHASAPRQLTLSHPDFEKLAKSGFYNEESKWSTLQQVNERT
jgi:hypothetical protein